MRTANYIGTLKDQAAVTLEPQTKIVPRRVPRVNALDPLMEVGAQRIDEVDEAVDQFAFHAKTILTVFLLTVMIIVGILVIWNTKNALGIDIFPGEHHDLIDKANAAIGI